MGGKAASEAGPMYTTHAWCLSPLNVAPVVEIRQSSALLSAILSVTPTERTIADNLRAVGAFFSKTWRSVLRRAK